ncbi:hypothetical protein KCP77_08545 [Salmonella enterica subsp. enterica]|nr:hypothetical protein KCP77_08545 [Salmonella enterica subsp. enterica]
MKRNEIKRLTDGRVGVLVATDAIAARGIDIPDVSHVINFDMPRGGDTYYLHRIGRHRPYLRVAKALQSRW